MADKELHDIVTYGGGVQSTTIAMLIIEGKLPRPEHIIMADTRREKSSVWEYLETVTRPRLREVGLDVEIVSPSDGEPEIYSNKGTLKIPAHDGPLKLHNSCSIEWKQRPVRQRMRELGYGPSEPVRLWFGITIDEYQRIRKSDVKWIANWYPFINIRDARMTRSMCFKALKKAGWPIPPRSSCWMCPNRSGKEWLEMSQEAPEDFRKAVEFDNSLRDNGGDVYLHWSRVPLSEISVFNGNDNKFSTDDICGDACWT